MIEQCTIEEFNLDIHSLKEITELLHDSYSVHLKNNLQFWATHQSEEETLRRFESGKGFVLKFNNKLIGTITYYGKCENNNCSYYKNIYVGRFGQFAVDRQYQKNGLGNLLINKIIEVARNDYKTELALDTSELAIDLINYYNRKGFNKVSEMQWHDVNYKSIILSKKI